MTQKGNELLTRKLESDDWPIVSEIAAKIPGFSVPSEYVIWMLAETQGNLCRVLLDVNEVVIGYALLMRTQRNDEVFFWQLGFMNYGQDLIGAALALCSDIFKEMRSSGLNRLRYTTRDNSKMSRFVEAIISELSGATPLLLETKFVSRSGKSGRKESEYLVIFTRNGRE